ncbi:beta-lactamase/transpeptidase-like protein [Crassisporium funariophilum]|nr:beta-lactamase/transpeptidase-like protein [Crassisporium funariophilum]
MVTLSIKAPEILDQLLLQAVQNKRLPGAAFAAGTADKELYFGAAGSKVLDEPSSGKIDETSVFWVCSHTKLLVTVAVLQLVELGKIGYDTPVTEIIPEMANPIVLDDISAEVPTYKPAKTVITLKHLLNHTSGLFYSPKRAPGTLPAGYTSAAYKGDHSVNQFFNISKDGLPSVPLKFEPGTDFTYGWNCDIIAFIVERITGKTIEEYCKENIFDVLGMTSSSFYLTPSLKSDLVSMSYRNQNGELEAWTEQINIIEQDPEKVTVRLGGIGLYCTVRDYLTLLRHLLLVYDGRATNPILSGDTVRALFRPTLSKQGSNSVDLFTGWTDCQFGVGLCLNNSDYPGRRRKGSGFWYGWAGTYYFMDPTTGIAAVYGTQVVPTRDPEVLKLWEQLEEALYAVLVV